MTIGIIPAKLNSSRVPGKNLRKTPDGETLIESSIRWMSQFGFVDRIIVSTDDRVTLLREIDVSQMDSRVSIWQRTPDLMDPDLPLIDLYRAIAHECPLAEHIFATQPDNPFKPPFTYVLPLWEDYKTNKRDEVFSVSGSGVKTGSMHLLRVSSLNARKIAYYVRTHTDLVPMDINTEDDWRRYQKQCEQAGTI